MDAARLIRARGGFFSKAGAGYARKKISRPRGAPRAVARGAPRAPCLAPGARLPSSRPGSSPIPLARARPSAAPADLVAHAMTATAREVAVRSISHERSRSTPHAEPQARPFLTEIYGAYVFSDNVQRQRLQ